MSASHGCSQKAYEQRKTGYKFLSGITSLSAFAATSFAIGDAQKNREGKKLLDDTKVFLMAVTGATVGILSFLTVSPDCVVKEKNKNIHFWYIQETTSQSALTFRAKERKQLLKNLLINTSLATILSILTKDQQNKEAIYMAGGFPLVIAGIQSLFINDDDLVKTGVTIIKTPERFSPGIAFIKIF